MKTMNNNLDNLFESARNQSPKTTFSKTKEQFLVNVNQTSNATGKAKFLTLKNGLIMLAAITTIGISVMYLMNPSNNKKEVVNTLETINIENNIVLNDESNETIKIERNRDKGKITFVSTKTFDAKNIISENRQKKLAVNLKSSLVTVTSAQKEFNVDDSFHFPVLTDEEIKENNNQKEKMLKQLTKFDKKKYVYIPSGTTKIDEREVSVQAFYMQNTEVSVLEYRTFLHDLIIQKREKDFFVAKPDQTQWVKMGEWLKPMQDHYFTHPAYDDYPINNISREGAELYCRWLNEEYSKKYSNQINDVRIPATDEWIYAASADGKNYPYPWGGPYYRNSNGCYLANFKPGIDTLEVCDNWNKLKNVKKTDSLYDYKQTMDDVKLPKNHENPYSADGGYYTVKVGSYNPNDFGLYCMSGNVAEMTIDKDGNPVSKGGSWKSIGADIQINSKTLFEGVTTPSVEIGFRPVITFLDSRKPLIGIMGKTTSDLPPGTVQISNELYFDATEISNFSWKEYVYWQAKIYGKTSNEYKEALPDTTVWGELNKAYTTHYYSHPAYNNYPVIGISYEQALAFCKWRTERVKQLYKINNEIGSDFEYRLPTQAEWENIAKAGYSSINAKKDGDKHKFNLKKSKADLEGVASKLNDNADVTAPTEAYWPNNYGVYNIIGNVAEMVQEKGIAKGGSWKHTAEEASLENKLTYNKPASWLGFRCVCEVKK